MDNPSAIIRFLRACYEADNRETAVTNLLHKSIRHRIFLTDEEHLLCGLLNRVPVDRATAIAISKEASLYRREKTLLYCAFPVVGRPPEGSSRFRTTLCAPLLSYPASLINEESTAYVKIDPTQQQVNLPILAELLADTKANDVEVEELVNEFPHPPFNKDDIQGLMSLLLDFVPHMDALSLAQFPKLEDESKVRKAVSKAGQPGFCTCLSACAVVLAPNSPDTRGVLFELSEIARGEQLSAPLQVVFGQADPGHQPWQPPVRTRVPTVLSRAQQRVLVSAASAPLTLVVGPPGTGKSYTIAAAAVDHLSRGESVLIACRKHQAVDVIAKMVDDLLGPNQCVIRGGQQQRQRELKAFLEHILQGIRFRMRVSDGDAEIDEDAPNRQLEALDKQILDLERDITAHFDDEVSWGRLTMEESRGFFHRALCRWKLHWLTRRLDKRAAVWKRIQQYERFLRESELLTRELLKARIDARIELSLKRHRRDLTRFLSSLRARGSTRQQELFSTVDPHILFGTFPIWLTCITDASEIVPLQNSVFDIAIFDEATQCDMASCIPIMQRAKRAVVVGDPNQLRHVSFLGNDRLRRLSQDHGLDEDQQQRFHYRRKSVLDLLNESIESQDHVHFLDEHFRSMPQIISFSNKMFYDSALSIMRLRPKTAQAQFVFPMFTVKGTKTGGTNPIEARRLVDELVRLIDQQAALPVGACQSMGILSPFRDQVDLISRQLEQRLPLEAFERHQLQVGTAHAFQGDERDVMLLSLVVDAGAHHASLRFVSHPNLLNVAITRARHQQYVFFSISPQQLPVGSLLRRYLESITSQPQPVAVPAPAVADEFLNEVRTHLQGGGARTWSEYELAGQLIDLVVEKAGKTCGIDLLGYPGQYEGVLDLERYRILQRAGFPLFPLPYSRWCHHREACLLALNSLLAATP